MCIFTVVQLGNWFLKIAVILWLSFKDFHCILSHFSNLSFLYCFVLALSLLFPLYLFKHLKNTYLNLLLDNSIISCSYKVFFLSHHPILLLSDSLPSMVWIFNWKLIFSWGLLPWHPGLPELWYFPCCVMVALPLLRVHGFHSFWVNFYVDFSVRSFCSTLMAWIWTCSFTWWCIWISLGYFSLNSTLDVKQASLLIPPPGGAGVCPSPWLLACCRYHSSSSLYK